MNLTLFREVFAVCHLPATAEIPGWAHGGPLVSATRTGQELSVVCLQESVPEDVRADRNWRCFEVEGPLDFSLTGILASLSRTLAEAGLSLFAISTFDTDYVLVKDVEGAIRAYREAGHTVRVL